MWVRVGPTSKVFLSEFKVSSLMLVPVCSRNQYREFRWHFLCYLILLKCIFTWKPSYSFPIRASWFLDRGGSWTWTRPGCRVSQESQIQCWDLRRWCLYYQLSSHRDAAMHGLGGGDTLICYQDPGRKRKNARRCDKKWRRWSVGLLRWWRRGGGEREAAVRENTIHQDKFR